MKNIFTLLIFLLLGPEFSAAQKPVTLRITGDTLNSKPVSSLIYGNFIELGFGRQIEGLWNQKLNNASFEEVPPYTNHWSWLGRTPEDDLSDEVWWHSGYEENKWYTYPKAANIKIGYNRHWNFHHGLQSATIRNPLPEGKVWLAQDGIYPDPDSPMLFRGYFSNNQTADANTSPLELVIGIFPEGDFDHPIYESFITVTDGIWREVTREIPALGYRGRVTFAVAVPPGKTVAFDGFSLMPADDYKGWRPKAVEALRQIGVPMIRYPGGCFASFYDWRLGVGPRSERRPVVSEYWGGIEENQAGTAEYITLCNMTGAEPFLCANMLTGTADRAAAWVEYCNSPAGTPMGTLRREHGYPEPFGVRYWELDNETYRRFGPLEYAEKCVAFSRAMKAVDPSIRLVMVGYWRFNDHLREMLEIAGQHIDIVADRATGEEELRRDLEIIRQYNEANGTFVTLANTEWLAPLNWEQNTLDALNHQKPPGEMTLQQHQVSWHYAMNAARVLLLFQRLGGDFEFASFNNLANTWGQNIIECPKDTVVISAAGKIFQLMSHNPVSWILNTETDRTEPGLFFQAGISSEGDRIALYVLNYNSEEKHFRLDPGNFRVTRDPVREKSVFAHSPLISNTIRQPGNIHSSLRMINPSVSGDKMTFSVAPWSVVEIILKVY